MWPHSITLGIGSTAVVVGTDDPSLIEAVAPWRIDVERNVVDLALEAFPEQPSERSMPRPLPNLRHGSERLVKSEDVDALRTILLRMLAAHEAETPAGHLRITGTLLERNGRGVIVPLGSAALVAGRQWPRLGFEPVWAQSVLVDVSAGEALVDPALGSRSSARRLPLDTIWLSHREPTVDVSGGVIAARLLGNAGSLASLQDAVELMTRVRIRFVRPGRQDLEKALTAP